MATKQNSSLVADAFVDSDGNSPERRVILSAMPGSSTINTMQLYMAASSTVRVAIYSSSSAVETDAMTLVADLGEVTRGGTNGMQAIAVPGSPSIASGQYPVIAVRYPINTVGVIACKNLFGAFPPTGSADGDVIRARRAFDSGGAGFGGTSASFPSTSINDDDAEQEARVLVVSLDYSPAVSGSLGAIESESDVLASTGAVGNNGVRLTLRDTDTGALAASLTGLIVSIRATSQAAALLIPAATDETTDSNGVLEIASGSLGSIGSYVYVTVEKSDNSVVGCYRVAVVDLNA